MNNEDQNEFIKKLVDIFNPIESEVIRMMGNRSIFQELIDISKENKKIDINNSFWDFIKESYVALMVSAVCRQVDTDTRSSSLINFLNTIVDPSTAKKVTKAWYSQQYHKEDDILPGFMEGLGNSHFEENFGDKDFLDPEVVQKDLAKLIESTKEIKRYRNKRIAHRDSNNDLVFDVNFNDLDKSLEVVREITSKYYLLLKQGGNDLIPTDQTDWQEILTIPWIEKDI